MRKEGKGTLTFCKFSRPSSFTLSHPGVCLDIFALAHPHPAFPGGKASCVLRDAWAGLFSGPLYSLPLSTSLMSSMPLEGTVVMPAPNLRPGPQ